MLKYLNIILLVLLVTGICFSIPVVAQGALTESQIQSILSLLTSFGADATTVANVDASLRGTTPTTPTTPTGIPADFQFTKTLLIGSVDQDVVYLKIVLASEGCVSALGNTTYFGSSTKAGVQCFQQKYGIDELGTTGSNTRAKLNEILRVDTISIPPLVSITTPSITVTSPNGGETWTQGNTHTITWTSIGLSSSEQVAISLINANTLLTAYTISYGASPLVGSYLWTMPATISAGDYKIGVFRHVGDIVIDDYSDNSFSIVSPSIAPSVTFTVDGVANSLVVVEGAIPTFVWSATNAVSCSSSGGTSNWAQASRPTSGSVELLNPLQVSATYTLTCINSSGASTSKNIQINVLEAITPSITVISPNGGEIWKVGETKRVSWSSTGLSATDRVNIYIEIKDVNLSGSGSTNYITSNNVTVPALQGYYDWTIAQNQLPQSASLPHQYKIRVDVVPLSTSQTIIRDWSDSNFQISLATPPTPTPAPNSLSVVIDGATPISTNLESVSGVYPKDKVFTKIKFMAGSSDRIVNSLTVALKYDNLVGVINNANGQPGLTLPLINQYYLSNIKVMDGTTQLGQTIRSSGITPNNFSSFDVVTPDGVSFLTGLPVKETRGTYYYTTIGASLQIPANTSKTIFITADVVSFMQNYNLPIQLGLSGVSSIPIYGNKMFIVPPKPALSATITTSNPRELSNQGVSGIYVDLGTFRFAAKYNDVYIKKLKLKKLGTLPTSAIKSIWLKIARTDALMSDYQTNPITSQIVDSSGYITFQPTSQSTTGVILVSKNYYTYVTVRALVSGEVGETIGVGIDSSEAFESNADIQGTTFPLNNTLITRALISSATGNTAQANSVGEDSQTGGILNIISRIKDWLEYLIKK
ncbi:hypothetical protein KKE19_04215 [Patescibacteria group bacterium]|nr:hypothetical protein [Patescibacteria group bacterium]MBU4462192.1 hypothetical protein [Patescibacteria group bacterium]